jgi:hypothetical protein
MRLRRQKEEEEEGLSAADTIRHMLLGEVPIQDWPPADGSPEGEPWTSFVRARDAVHAGNEDEAARLWLSVAQTDEVESRQVLQAWTFLRQRGVIPAVEEAAVVHGVICEVAVQTGHDVLAAYRDGSARYLNYSGNVVVLEPGGQAQHAVSAVISAAEPLGQMIGVWDQPELPAVPAGHGRLLLLTPAGFRFGQGPQSDLLQEPVAGFVFNAATQLMLLMTGLASGKG